MTGWLRSVAFSAVLGFALTYGLGLVGLTWLLP